MKSKLFVKKKTHCIRKMRLFRYVCLLVGRINCSKLFINAIKCICHILCWITGVAAVADVVTSFAFFYLFSFSLVDGSIE